MTGDGKSVCSELRACERLWGSDSIIYKKRVEAG